MKWFQHSTDSHDDPDISDAEDLFGDAGYNVFFKILEVYGREFNQLNDEGWLRISRTFVRRKLRKSWTKVEQMLNFYSERQRIMYEIDGQFVSIKIPRFLDISGNWAKRKNINLKEKLCSPSVVPLAKEKEEEEKKKKKRINNIYKGPAQEVLDFLNEKAGQNYKDTSNIIARLKQKKTVDECKQVILNKIQDPFFIENPRLMNPVTLFRPKHWDAYLNYKPTGKKMSGVTQQNVSFLDKWRPIER